MVSVRILHQCLKILAAVIRKNLIQADPCILMVGSDKNLCRLTLAPPRGW